MFVDLLAEKTFEPYSYTGNNPIMFTDPTGMSKKGKGWIQNLSKQLSPTKIKSDLKNAYHRSGVKKAVDCFRGKHKYESIPKKSVELGELEFNGYIPDVASSISTIQCHQTANISDIKIETSPYLQGGLNILSGTLGTIGAAGYVVGSEGIGVPLGGAAALTLSIGQVSLGISQIGDLMNNNNNEVLQASGSIPGYGARLMKSPYSNFIDAGANLLPTHLGTAGGLKMAIQNNLKGLSKGEQVLKNGYELYDTTKATNDLINAKKIEN